MWNITGSRKDSAEAGLKQLTREDYYGAGSDTEPKYNTLTNFEVGSPELSAWNMSANASANIPERCDQLATGSAHPTVETPSQVLDTESGFESPENCFISIDEDWALVFQSPQETFISNGFPDLIWEPFNPKSPNMHRGTIDPRSNPASFEDLLKSLQPRKFNPYPSFTILTRSGERENVGWSQDPKTERHCCVNKSSLPRYMDSTKLVTQPPQSTVTDLVQNVEAASNVNSNAETPLPNLAEGFRPIAIGDGSLPYENASQDDSKPFKSCLTTTNLVSSSGGESNVCDQDLNHGSAREEAPNPSSLANDLKKRKYPINDISVQHDVQETADNSPGPTNVAKKHRCSPSGGSTHRVVGEPKTKNASCSTTNPKKPKNPTKAKTDNKKAYRGQKKAPDQRWTSAEGEIVSAELERLQKEDEDTHGKDANHSEKLYERASIALRSQGIFRNAGSLRGYMNRKGRARHGYDERKVKHDVKSVGLQPNRSKKQRDALKAKEEEAERLEKATQELGQVRTSQTVNQHASNVATPLPMVHPYAQQSMVSPYAKQPLTGQHVQQPSVGLHTWERVAETVQEWEERSEEECAVGNQAQNEEETAAERARFEETLNRMRANVEDWNHREQNSEAQNAVQMAQEQAENEELDRLEAEQRRRMPSDELEDEYGIFGYKRLKRMPNSED